MIVGAAGDESDQLGRGDGGAHAGGFVKDGGADFVERSRGEVYEIDGDLGAIAGGERQADGLDEGKSSRGLANRFGDGAGDFYVTRGEVEVEGDEEITRTDDGGAGGGMSGEVADIRRERIEAWTANAFETLAAGGQGGGFVEINGDLESAPNFAAGMMRCFDTLVEAGAVQGDEGDHIGGSDARMDACVEAEVDRLRGASGSANGRFGDGGRFPGEGDDAAVMIAVHFPAEDEDAFHAADGIDNRANDVFVAAFGEIGDAFDHAVRS